MSTCVKSKKGEGGGKKGEVKSGSILTKNVLEESNACEWGIWPQYKQQKGNNSQDIIENATTGPILHSNQKHHPTFLKNKIIERTGGGGATLERGDNCF